MTSNNVPVPVTQRRAPAVQKPKFTSPVQTALEAKERAEQIAADVQAVKDARILRSVPSEPVPYRPFFVYGTLRRSGALHGTYLFHRNGTVERAFLEDHAIYVRPQGNSPGIPYVATKKDFFVMGDLVYIAADEYKDAMRALDKLEGYTPGDAWNHYYRVVVKVENRHGEAVEAWAYTVPQNSYMLSDKRPLGDGDYIGYVERVKEVLEDIRWREAAGKK